MIVKVRNLFTLLGFLTLVLVYQNCGDVKLAPLTNTKLSCDPSVYNIAREAQTVNGQTVYFIQQNNYDISNEYSEYIEWTVNGVLQIENITHNNRLLLNCETHPQQVEIRATLVTDCGTEIEIFHSDTAPNTCEEAPPSQPPESGSEMTYCDEYKQKYPGVENVPGFTTALQAIDMRFEDGFVWDNQLWPWDGNHPVPSFEAFMLREPSSTGSADLGRSVFFKAPLRGDPGMRMRYIAIPLKVPESSPYMTLDIPGTMNYMTVVNGTPTVSISPCKGDFRFKNPNGIGQSEKASPYCVKQTKGDDPNPLRLGFNENTSQKCYIPKGKTVWLNIAFYSFNNQSDPNLPPIPDFENGGFYNCIDIGSPGFEDPVFSSAACGFWAPGIRASGANQ